MKIWAWFWPHPPFWPLLQRSNFLKNHNSFIFIARTLKFIFYYYWYYYYYFYFYPHISSFFSFKSPNLQLNFLLPKSPGFLAVIIISTGNYDTNLQILSILSPFLQSPLWEVQNLHLHLPTLSPISTFKNPKSSSTTCIKIIKSTKLILRKL